MKLKQGRSRQSGSSKNVILTATTVVNKSGGTPSSNTDAQHQQHQRLELHCRCRKSILVWHSTELEHLHYSYLFYYYFRFYFAHRQHTHILYMYAVMPMGRRVHGAGMAGVCRRSCKAIGWQMGETKSESKNK